MINVTGAGDEYRNLLNGIVTIRPNDYVTNGINANPETKLMYGQLLHQSATGLHDLRHRAMLTLLFFKPRLIEFHTRIRSAQRRADELMCGRSATFRVSHPTY